MHSTRFDMSFATDTLANSFRPHQPRPTTYAEIVGVEPRVADLVREAAALRSSRRVTWRDYDLFKRRAQRLVGRDARRPALQSSIVYDLVLRRLITALGV